jgi:hypothetical protein
VFYFLDALNLPITVRNTSERHLIYASTQYFGTVSGANAGVENVSATIIRSRDGITGMTGPLPSSFPYINLANGKQNDVKYPPASLLTQASLDNLNTSLWTISLLKVDSSAVNGGSIIMQSIDTSFNSTGTYYYGIRVNTDSNSLYFGNIRMSSINLN